MSLSKRLADIENNLNRLYEKLGAMERSLIMAYDAEAKFSINQRIREEIKPQIRQAQIEYWQCLARETYLLIIDDVDASNTLIKVSEIANIIEQDNANEFSEHTKKILVILRNKLNEPGKCSD